MGVRERLRRLEDARLNPLFNRRIDRVVGPTGEGVILVRRRHWLVLLAPAVLAVGGCLVLVRVEEPRTWLVVFAASKILFDRWRRHWSPWRTAMAAAPWAVALWLARDLGDSLFRAGAAIALLLVLLAVIAGWWTEVLVLTDTSLWKLTGVLTTASPKAPLTQILFQDVRQSAMEQVLRCGTLIFDTAAENDAPLARFGPVDDPYDVSAQISRQRGQS